ncbi:MAG: cytochrome P450 [Kofleriaceae bacterium]|nr:cytochrome P450 [Kofleriaceae bacterium]
MDLANPDSYAAGIPYAELARLRREAPVAWQPEVRGRGFWAVTRYHDILTVLKTPAVFSSWRGGALLEDPPPEFLAKLRENMLNRDPPDHTKLRKLVNHVFSPKRIGLLEAKVKSHARELVESVIGRDRCDFATEVAGQLPLFVICEILGVPESDRQRLYALTARMFGSTIADREAALRDGMDAAAEVRAYAAELERARRTAPTDDLASDLLSAEIDGRRLTEGEFQAFFMLLFNAGSDTTRSLLCFGLQLLLQHPADLARLRADPTLLPGAIEEMLRFEPAVIQFRRTATRDTELAGTRIAEGDKVVVFFPSANRDEHVFTDPDRFDIARAPNPHLAFGHGTHFCLGAPLARMESVYLFRSLLECWREIEPAGALVTSRSNFIRSVHHQPLRIRTF